MPYIGTKYASFLIRSMRSFCPAFLLDHPCDLDFELELELELAPEDDFVTSAMMILSVAMKSSSPRAI